MAVDSRSECKQCGVHTFRAQCGNCGSTELMAVAESHGRPEGSRRFSRERTLRVVEGLSGRGLRSGSAH